MSSSTSPSSSSTQNVTSKSPTNSSSTPAQAQDLEDPSQTLTYHILLLLLAFTALYALMQLPRAWVRGEGGRGWVLWFSKGRGSARGTRQTGYSGEREKGGSGTRRERRRERGRGRNAYPPNVPNDIRDIDDHDDIDDDEKSHSRRLRHRLPRTLNLPTHIPSLPAFLHSFSVPLHSPLPLFPSLSPSKLLILALYTLPWIYALLQASSSPLTDPTRSGWIATAQLPLVLLLCAKNGVLGWVFGGGVNGFGSGNGGYERVNWMHRWAGRGVVVGGWVHSAHYFYKWALAGTFTKNIKSPSNAWGMVAFVALTVIFVFSLKGVRERAFNVFLGVHVVGFGVLVYAIYKHKPTTLPYILSATFLYALDHTLRALKTRYTTARLVPLPELEMTRVEIPGINKGWRAGQHVRLRVLGGGGAGAGMGWMGWMEVHPFTIASVAYSGGEEDEEGEEEGGGEGIVLMCKRTGTWTRRLYEIAKLGGYTSNIPLLESGLHHRGGGGNFAGGREVRVLVEGPYGGPGTTNYASFSAAVLVCGGSGITYALGVIGDLVRKDVRGRCRVKVVELVWIVTDPACLAPLLPTFTDLIRQSVYTPLRISVFYTRAPTGKQPAYFDAVDASPFAAAAAPMTPSPNVSGSSANPAGNNVTFNPNVDVNTYANENTNENTTDSKHRSHTLISPISSDAHAFAQAYQQRLENQRSTRSRPPPSRRPSSPYEAPRAAPAPPSAYNNSKPQSGPQRQDSNASAKTLVDTTSRHKSSLKRTNTLTNGARHLPPGLTLAPGRPKLSKFLEHALQRATLLSPSHANPKDDDARGGGGRLCGMAVGVCGPEGLARDVRTAVAGLEGVRRRQVGGVEVVEEVFGS